MKKKLANDTLRRGVMIRVPVDLAEKLERLAEGDRRSLGAFCLMLIEESLATRKEKASV